MENQASEPLILRENKKPTFFNKEAAIGFFIAPIIGTVIGGMIGKKRMEQEEQFGKIVSEPTAWNKDTVLGLLLGGVVAGLTMLALITTAPVVAVIAAPVIMTVATIIGGHIGAQRMEREYQQAVMQDLEKHPQDKPSHVLERLQEAEKALSPSYFRDLVSTSPAECNSCHKR